MDTISRRRDIILLWLTTRRSWCVAYHGASSRKRGQVDSRRHPENPALPLQRSSSDSIPWIARGRGSWVSLPVAGMPPPPRLYDPVRVVEVGGATAAEEKALYNRRGHLAWCSVQPAPVQVESFRSFLCKNGTNVPACTRSNGEFLIVPW